MRIDFVSDIACPWCAVGLASFERALARLGDAVTVEVHFQPFELNPAMGPDGEDAAEHLQRKYGLDTTRLEQARATLRERGEAVGFTFGARDRIWNTFDAHRLLAWADTLGGDAQWRLKRALLAAYHGDGLNPSDRDVLLDLVGAQGLPVDEAEAVLDEGAFADDVRAAEAALQRAGIQAVPSVIIDGRQLLQGAQPPDVFERALRELAAAAD
jgi:predicted DsbA family dithiol-disulfide isomerase